MSRIPMTAADKLRRYLKRTEHRTITLHAEHNEEVIFFSRACLLPILDILVTKIERSRQKFNPLSPALMALIYAGINTVEKISTVLAIELSLIENELNTMFGSGWLNENDEGLSLSPLGKLSYETNQAHVIVEQRLRLCAITGKLLPRAAYEYPVIKTDELAERQSSMLHYLPELQEIPLNSLNLTAIKDKSKLNISDETIAIQEVVSYEGAFQEGRLVSLGRGTPNRMLIAFKNDLSHDVSSSHLSTWLRLDKKQIKSTLRSTLEKQNIGDIEHFEILEFGLVVVKVANLSDKFLRSIQIGLDEAGVSAQGLYLCGTDRFSPRPIHRYPHWADWDVLKGFAMYIYAISPIQVKEINALRSLEELRANYRRTPVYQREGATEGEYIAAQMDSSELLVAGEAADRYEIKQLIKLFDTINFEAMEINEKEGFE